MGDDPTTAYWHLRQKVMLYDVPETPIEIYGPDADRLLNKVFTPDITKLKTGRAGYAIACYPNGGILMDGVLIRLTPEHYWYVQADGEFDSWLRAHSIGMDVQIRDPDSWVLQIQGPESLNLLAAVIDAPLEVPLKYFDTRILSIGGQTMLVSRTGWTGELGIELYTNIPVNEAAHQVTRPTNADNLWSHLMQKGEHLGLRTSGLQSMGIRRLEAGIMDNGSDLTPQVTPLDVGMANFVNFNKPDFIGKSALEQITPTNRMLGLRCNDATPLRNSSITLAGNALGEISSSGYSPFLNCGIAFVRLTEQANLIGAEVTLTGTDGLKHKGQLCNLPFYDVEKKLARGLEIALWN